MNFAKDDAYPSEESSDNLEMAYTLFRQNQNQEGMNYLKKAMKDPRNLDAWVQYALFASNDEETISRLVAAEAQGRRILEQCYGPDCFTKSYEDGGCVGAFWGYTDTRPYMRVLNALSDKYVEVEKYDTAAEMMIDMLRLCPRDNVGKRMVLPAVLVLAGRCEEALSYAQGWIQDEEAHPDGSTPPSKVPLPPDVVQKHIKWGCSEHYHSAALAAFRLWGDCEVARQYLEIGAHLNPAVLRRILARTERPHGPKRRARELNSPEEAHDYLWLVQDAWMVPDVWEWANAQERVKRLLLRKCSRGECDNREETILEFRQCSACRNAFYCSVECQRSDWVAHKNECKSHQRRKAEGF